MDTLYKISKQYFRTDLPSLQVGDKVEVATKNFRQSEKEKNDSVSKTRLTHFKGTVIAQKNQNQISYTFSVLKDSSVMSICRDKETSSHKKRKGWGIKVCVGGGYFKKWKGEIRLEESPNPSSA